MLRRAILLIVAAHAFAAETPPAPAVAVEPLKAAVSVRTVNIDRYVTLPDGDAAKAVMQERCLLYLNIVFNQEVVGIRSLTCRRALSDAGEDLHDTDLDQGSPFSQRDSEDHRTWNPSLQLRPPGRPASRVDVEGDLDIEVEQGPGSELAVDLATQVGVALPAADGATVTVTGTDAGTVTVLMSSQIIKGVVARDKAGAEIASEGGNSSTYTRQGYYRWFRFAAKPATLRFSLYGPLREVQVPFTLGGVPLTAPIQQQAPHWTPPVTTENLDLRIVPAPGAMQIDGDTKDWDLSTGIFACGNALKQRDEAAVWIHAMWDAENLYLLARWTDTTPMNNPLSIAAGDLGFKGDCLQVRILTSPAGLMQEATSRDVWANEGKDLPRTRTSHLTAWRDRNGRDTVGITWGWHFDEGSLEGKDQGVKQAFRLHADKRGYDQELAIPWSLLSRDGWKPAADVRIALTVEPNFSLRGGGRSNIRDIFRAGVDFDPDMIYRDPSAWGLGTLEAKGRLPPRPVRLQDGREAPVRLVDGLPVVDWNRLAKPKPEAEPVPVPLTPPAAPGKPSDF